MTQFWTCPHTPPSVKVITFPWPPKELSPNARVHWAQKHRIGTNYWRDCLWVLREQKIGEIEAKSLVLSVMFRPPSKRRADLDNMVASCKKLFDAISWRTLVDDSNFSLVIAKGEPIKGGAVEVEIQPIKQARAA